MLAQQSVCMKGRNGSTRVETTQQTSVKSEHVEQERDRQSFSTTRSMFQRQPRSIRLIVAIAGLAITFLVGVFLVGYGSKLFEDWRERRLLEEASTLLQQGNLSHAAQMAQDSPDGIRILSQRCRSWRTQRKDKILKRPLHGASGSRCCCQKIQRVSLILLLLRSALERPISRVTRLIESLRAIGTAQRSMSLLVGWHAQKVILPSRRNNSQLR